jgi:hypothetical protein
MLTTIIYTVLAQSALQIDPGVREAILADDRTATLNGVSAAFAQAGGVVTGGLFYVFISIIGWKTTFGIFDAFSRGQADMTYYFFRPLQRFGMKRLYFAFLWFLILFGIAMLFFTGAKEGPAAILDILSVASTFVMGAYCLLLLGTNNILLPKKIRPNIVINVLLAFAALFYLGMLTYSYFRFGTIL